MPYQWAVNYNNAAGLADIDPQPAMPEIEPGLLRPDGNGLVVEDGYKSCKLKFDEVITDSEMNALYTLFGWTDAIASIAGTFRVKGNQARAFANYNAIADRPRGQYRNGFWYNVSIDIHHMDAL